MENADPNIGRVQHVAKASSDQLLRKFAEVECDSKGKVGAKELRVAKRVKRNEDSNAKTSGSSFPERKSLLPAPPAPRKLMRRLGLSRAKIKAREIKNKSIITAIEKVRTLPAVLVS